MDLNEKNLRLRPRKMVCEADPILDEHVRLGNEARHSMASIQCMNAPAFESTRKARRAASLSLEAVRGSMQAAYRQALIR